MRNCYSHTVPGGHEQEHHMLPEHGLVTHRCTAATGSYTKTCIGGPNTAATGSYTGADSLLSSLRKTSKQKKKTCIGGPERSRGLSV